MDKNDSQDEEKEEPKGISQHELLEQLAAQVEHFDKLPEHVKFSFVTNADLCYLMLLVLNILKKGIK